MDPKIVRPEEARRVQLYDHALSVRPGERVPKPGAAFLLSQLGTHASQRWTARLEAIDLGPREAMLLRQVALAEGRSQGDMARAVGLPSSRIVSLVDRLEARGWTRRRTSPDDRRTRSLFLTDSGRDMVERIASASAEHETELTGSLDPADRKRVTKVLRRLAGDLGLVVGVEPAPADADADPSR